MVVNHQKFKKHFTKIKGIRVINFGLRGKILHEGKITGHPQIVLLL